jgi:hypothetical protein
LWSSSYVFFSSLLLISLSLEDKWNLMDTFRFLGRNEVWSPAQHFVNAGVLQWGVVCHFEPLTLEEHALSPAKNCPYFP